MRLLVGDLAYASIAKLYATGALNDGEINTLW